MRAGRLIREQRALAAADAKSCASCGHPICAHFERKFGTPGYAPAVFYCTRTGCDCRMDFR